MTEAEHEAIRARATAQGVSLNTLFREGALAYRATPAESDELLAQFRAVAAQVESRLRRR